MRLRTKDTSFWVEVEDVRLRVQPLTASQRNRLLEACTTTHMKRNQPVRDLDAAEYNTRLFVRTVQEWEGAEDEDGAPLDCTEDNCRIVAERNMGWALDVLDAAEQGATDLAEDAKKNSPPSLTVA